MEIPSRDSLRRRPRQARAQLRLERILDTAERVFADVGYDAATTNAIASQAETSIGSLYEFFPNKEAIARSLAERYIDRIATLYATEVVDAPGVSPQALVDRIVVALDTFYRNHPAAIWLLNGRFTSPELIAAAQTLQAAFVDRIESVFESRRPDLEPTRRRMVATVLAEIGRALLVLADQATPADRSLILLELERAVIGYIVESIPEPRTQ